MTSPLARPSERGAPPLPSERTCPDCEHPAPGNFCPNCGQRQGPLHVSLLELFHDWVEEFLHFDSKLVHTLGPLVLEPGQLTLEYVRGRRTRYLRPFRLWFAITITYFVLLALLPAGAATSQIHVDRSPDAPQAKKAEVAPAAPGSGSAADRFAASVQTHFQRFTAQDQETISRRIQTTSADYGPHLVLALVPIFALLLKLLYRRAPLGEHFVFSFHAHAFHGVAALGLLLLECSPTLRERYPLLQLLPFAALAVYLPLALRRVHRQGVLRTLLKSGALFFAYLISWGLLQGALLLITILNA